MTEQQRFEVTDVYGKTRYPTLYAPWKDEGGDYNVLVNYAPLDSITTIHNRAQDFIARQGMRIGHEEIWPLVPIHLFDLPEEMIYWYREGESGTRLPDSPSSTQGDLVNV